MKKNYLKGMLMAFTGLLTAAAYGQVTYSYTGAVETYTVPAGVSSIQIETNGAAGGNGSAGTGGLGAQMIGTFAVTPGQILDIMVGESPATTNGGGGGTFVVDQATGDPLIVAGGGGGGAGSCCGTVHNGQPGVITEDGTAGLNASGGTGAGGVGGNGGGVGTQTQNGGAGGGFYTDGADGFSSTNGGKAYVNGGAGGVNYGGGYGGGGGSYCSGTGCAGGGGGGYSGGGSTGGGGQWGGGGGGGSFNSGTDQANTGGINSGNGSVIITELCDGLVASVSADTLCQTDELILHAESTNGGTVTWDMGVIDSVPFFPDTVGLITYTATSDTTADCNFVTTVYVKPAPEFTLTSTDVLTGSDGAIFLALGSGIFPLTYDWDNDGTGDFDDPANLTGLDAGTYTVTVMNGNGCTRTDSATVNSQLAISENGTLAAVAYPNPTSDQLTIRYPGSFEYTISNSLGQVVLEGVGSEETSVSFANLADGNYLIKVISNDRTDLIRVVKK